MHGMRSSANEAGANHTPRRGLESHSFPKEMRLRKRRDFVAVQKAGRKFHGKYFLAVLAVRADGGGARVGITVSRKVGKAMTRNRIKRYVREYVRHSTCLPGGVDMVIVAKPSAAELREYATAASDLAGLEAKIDSRHGSRSSS